MLRRRHGFVTCVWLLSLVMTCGHFRHCIPEEDADELRAVNPLPCPVCDNRPQRNTQIVIWSPRLTEQPRQSSVAAVGKWLCCLVSAGFAHFLPNNKPLVHTT